MKYIKFFIVYAVLAYLASGCGRPRTSGDLPSPEQIKTVTDTFVIGQTTMTDTIQKLGPWQSSGQTELTNYVIYWTNDGKQTQINFSLVCDSGCDCVIDGMIDYTKTSHMVYSGSIYSS